MLRGALFSMLAGIFIALQSIFNSRASEKIGLWHTNVFVHGSGLILAFLILLMNEKVNFTPIKNVTPYYLFGGCFGVFIVFSVMKGISYLGVSYAITILIVTQIIIGLLINYFGLFGESIVTLSGFKILGLLLMISGVIIYQLT